VLKSVDPGIRVVACQPAASNVMQASVAAGRIVDQPSSETLSDGSAGGVVSKNHYYSPLYVWCPMLSAHFQMVRERSTSISRYALAGARLSNARALQPVCGRMGHSLRA
jgi:hypothetical protein